MADKFASALRPDGRIEVEYEDGSTKLLWPIDAREQVEANKGAKLVSTATTATRVTSTRSLQAPAARMPGGSRQKPPAQIQVPGITPLGQAPDEE